MERYENLLEPIMVDISDFGVFTRKVKFNFFTIDADVKEVKLNYTIFSYSPDKEEISEIRKNDNLRATMDVFVDKKGNYVPSNTDGAIPEYVFYLMYLQYQTFDMKELITKIIKQADSSQRFDFK